MKMCNGLSFSERIKWRVRGLWLLLLVMLAYMIVIGELGLGDSRMMTDLAEQVSRIIFFGGMIWVVCRIVRNRKDNANHSGRSVRTRKRDAQDYDSDRPQARHPNEPGRNTCLPNQSECPRGMADNDCSTRRHLCRLEERILR